MIAVSKIDDENKFRKDMFKSTLIYHIQTLERRIMQHLFLIGENTMKKMEKL